MVGNKVIVAPVFKLGQAMLLFLDFPALWWRRNIVAHKLKKRIWKEWRKAPTSGHCAEVGRKCPFHHRGLAPFVTWPAVGTYSTLNVSSLPSLPLEIIWQYPFDQRSAAASPMEVKCIKWYRRQNLYDIPCSTALQLCVDYSLRDRCIVFIQEVSVSPSMTYEIIDKSDKNFNTFPQVGVVWLWHVRHLSMTIRTFIHLRIIDSSKSAWYKSLNLYQSILSDRY